MGRRKEGKNGKEKAWRSTCCENLQSIYIFKNNKGADRRGFHHYLIYHDKYSGKNVAVQTTHLYQKDQKRFKELSQGRGIKMSLPGFETPSMIFKKAYVYNSKDKPLDFAHRDVHVKSKLSKSKARKVYQHVNRIKK